MGHKLKSRTEAAQELHVTPQRIDALVRDNKLTARRIAGHTVIVADDIFTARIRRRGKTIGERISAGRA